MNIEESHEGRNILRVNNYKVSQGNLKIELFEKGKRVENFHQLSGKVGESKARITLKVGSGSSEHGEELKKYIEYRFLKYPFESQAEYEKAQNEAHTNFL